MLRTLFWILAIAGLARWVLRLLRPAAPSGRKGEVGPETEADGVLVQDQVCGTYIDRRAALTGRDPKGNPLYFCSESCRRKAGIQQAVS